MLKMKLEPTMYKVFDANKVFAAVRQRWEDDIEGEFNEIYCPPQDGAILFRIPSDAEEMDELSRPERFVAMTLWEWGGMEKGESCYIHFDY